MASNDLARIANVTGADPRAILAAAIARPFNVAGASLEYDPKIPVAFGGGLLAAGSNELTIPDGKGALINKVTPEQLLAIVASIIVTSPSAAVACVRLRAEVSGWKFQQTHGSELT
jgi:hypothetical protein